MGTRQNIRLFQTAEHACGYFPERVARDLVLDPHDPALPALYGHALAMGFRRSGTHVYRPHCLECAACRPVRIRVADFHPNRAQARCVRRNADLEVAIRPAKRSDENFALYKRYLAARHAGGGMDRAEPADFDAFLAGPWSPTRFVEFRKDGVLLAVAVIDACDDALSAVYTWFDPAASARGLGTFAILTQVELARREGRDFVYLGFWIEDHPKMHYKQAFRPLEVLVGRDWRPLPEASA
jgi:arginine-tRNA-protein transferase